MYYYLIQDGYEAGNGSYSYELPASQTSDVTDMRLGSNIGIPGYWVMKINKGSVKLPPGEVELELMFIST